MTFHTPQLMSSPQPSTAHKSGSRNAITRSVTPWAVRLGSGLMALSLSVGIALPSLADPFRANTSTTPHSIGPLTEKAFEAIFKEGDYVAARQHLADAEVSESNEPLIHAMQASIAYLGGNIDDVYDLAKTTQSTAAALKSTDAIRGHLYSAVGIFLEGAYVLEDQGVARGTPTALGMLQQVFNELDEAESLDPKDPELNLVKGYMDLLLAVNLPFSNPDEAITRMNDHGSPTYLTQRGIAVGYRDLGQYDQAIAAVDKAIAAAPAHPELLYLKAQLLANQGAQGDSAVLFKQALTYSAQLPTSLVKQITWEGCIAEGLLNDVQCQAEREAAIGAF